MSNYKANQECPKCGSSSGLGVYLSPDDNRLNASCFRCGHYIHNMEKQNLEFKPMQQKSSVSRITKEEINSYKFAEQLHRKIPKQVYERYGVRMSVNQTSGEAETIYYPYYIKTMLSGYKVRELPKNWLNSIGSIKGVDLFGQHLCNGGKRLYITEGEEDAIAVYYTLRSFFAKKADNSDYKPSVVSLQNGAQGIAASLRAAKKLIDNYKEIVYIPDNDDAGKKSLKDAYLVLKDKLRVVSLEDKDPSEMIQESRESELLNYLLNPEQYKPGQVLTFSEILNQCTLEPEYEFCRPYPDFCKDLNYKTGGRRFGDLDLFIAGTSLGKSSFMRECVLYDLLKDSTDKVGVMFLEESTKRFGDAMISLIGNTRFHLDKNKQENSESFLSSKQVLIDSYGDKLIGYDHNSTEIGDSSFKEKLEYMVEEFGAKWIYIDHLHMLVSDSKRNTDQMAKIDSLMDYLSKFVTKYNVWIGMAAHLRKSTAGSGRNKYEQGLVPSLDDIKASGSAKQLAFQVIGLQRNLYHSQQDLRNVIALHVLKNRYNGRTGEADYLKFDETSGRIERCKKPECNLFEKDDSDGDIEI